MSRLREYITEHRREFDATPAPPGAWDRIEANIDAGRTGVARTRRLYAWWMVAASVVIVAGIGWLVSTRQMGSTTNEDTAPSLVEAPGSEYSLEAKRIFLQINEQQKQLRTLAADAPQLYRRFQQDLRALDSAYRELENQALHTPNHDVILDAMMQNLELQAGLLQKQLQILKEYNNQKQKNEKNNLRAI